MSSKKTSVVSKANGKPRGKLIYHSREELKERVGDKPSDIIEKSVIHAEDKLFCKFFEQKNGKKLRISVMSGPTGGKYKLTVKEGDSEPKVTEFEKKDLLSYLKKNDKLSFMLGYIEKTKTLSRPKKSKSAKTKSDSKSGEKTKSKSKSKSSKVKSLKGKSTRRKSSKSKSSKSKSK